MRLAPYVRRTPVLELEPGAFGLDGVLTLKLELLQHTGSFKPRGAFNRMLTAEVDASGVLAASGGNFGLAVAYAARVLGHPAEIFVPATSPAMKIERIRSYGATVHVVDGFYADAYAACEERAFDTGAVLMHPVRPACGGGGPGDDRGGDRRPGSGDPNGRRRGRGRRPDRGHRRLVSRGTPR